MNTYQKFSVCGCLTCNPTLFDNGTCRFTLSESALKNDRLVSIDLPRTHDVLALNLQIASYVAQHTHKEDGVIGDGVIERGRRQISDNHERLGRVLISPVYGSVLRLRAKKKAGPELGSSPEFRPISPMTA